MATSATDEVNVESFRGLRYAAYLNGSYNADREAFFDAGHRWLMFAVIVLGASALTDLLSPNAKLIATGLGAMAGAFDLVFDLSTRARKHGYLRRDYFGQAARLIEGSLTPEEAEAAMLLTAADEELPFYAAMALADNWATKAVYGDLRPTPNSVGFLARRVRHFVRYSGDTFSV